MRSSIEYRVAALRCVRKAAHNPRSGIKDEWLKLASIYRDLADVDDLDEEGSRPERAGSLTLRIHGQPTGTRSKH